MSVAGPTESLQPEIGAESHPAQAAPVFGADGEITLPDDRFIPLRPEDLAAWIEADPGTFGEVSERADALYRAIDRAIGQEVGCFCDEMDRRYAAFNPDRETLVPNENAKSEACEKTVLTQLGYLLDKCSFQRLEDPQVEAALSAANTHGMRVRIDPEMVDWVHLYVRGRGRVTRSRIQWRNLDWKKPWRGRPVEYDVFKRLAVIVRLKNERAVRLKLFRDIPIQDLEALLPHARIAMSRLDQLQVFGGGAGALGGVATKLIAGGIVAFSALLTTFAVALCGLAFKSFMGYRRNRKNRESQRTRHLYDQNMANNASVLHALLLQVQREEVKEVLLAYCMIASGAASHESELDPNAEAWLRTKTGRRIDFDHRDALETIARLQLWDDVHGFRVATPDRAIERLERYWREGHGERYHARSARSDLYTASAEQ